MTLATEWFEYQDGALRLARWMVEELELFDVQGRVTNRHDYNNIYYWIKNTLDLYAKHGRLPVETVTFMRECKIREGCRMIGHPSYNLDGKLERLRASDRDSKPVESI